MTALRSSIAYTALGVALIAGASAASAQTMITPQPVTTQTVTTETRTVRRLPAHAERRQVITTRTVTRRVVPAPTTVIDRSVATYPQPLYDEVTPAPAVVATSPDYARPLYDEVVTTPRAPIIDNGSIVGAQPYIYHYVYEPGRILVIDPTTGYAIQSIPR